MEATPLGELYMALQGAIARSETTLDALKEKEPDVESLVRRLREIRFELEFIVTGTDKKFVYWLERRNRGVFLRASPIDVAGLLQDKLFEEVPTVVLTSATLSSGGHFACIRVRLGLDTADDLIATATFDYERGYDVTLGYSRALRGLTAGAEVIAGRDVFGESYSRLAGFVRFGEEWAGGSAGGWAEEISRPRGAELFVDGGVNVSRVQIRLGDGSPKETTSAETAPHLCWHSRAPAGAIAARLRAHRCRRWNIGSPVVGWSARPTPCSTGDSPRRPRCCLKMCAASAFAIARTGNG
jgi:hypothetical protein